MKRTEIIGGPLGKEKRYAIIQDDDMLITAFGVNADSGAISNYGTPLGKLGDIEDPEVQDQILDKLRVL